MEELAKVVEMVSHLGDAGKTAFITWVVFKYLTNLTWAAVIGIPLTALLGRIGKGCEAAIKYRTRP